MTRNAIIEKTIKAINLLPEDKAEEISDFADFLIKQYEDRLITNSIQYLTSHNASFNFLAEEEELYTTADLKEKYNG